MDETGDNTILIVDDEPDIRDVLAISLQDMGYRTVEAENAATAFTIFKKEKPQVVVTDIKMPGGSGIELLRKIKHENPETEVIMITGHGDMNLAIRSLKHDATDFITKPIHVEALEIALRRAREKITMRRRLQDYTRSLEQLVREENRASGPPVLTWPDDRVHLPWYERAVDQPGRGALSGFVGFEKKRPETGGGRVDGRQ
jgi:DNA-binding NtrC family response regulator